MVQPAGQLACAAALCSSLHHEALLMQADIKKAYHTLALQLHPDKNPGDEVGGQRLSAQSVDGSRPWLQPMYICAGSPQQFSSTTKGVRCFERRREVRDDAEPMRRISCIHSCGLLPARSMTHFQDGSFHRRKLYDETGSLEDSEQLGGEAFNNLYEYYRTMYPKVGAALPQVCGAAAVLYCCSVLTARSDYSKALLCRFMTCNRIMSMQVTEDDIEKYHQEYRGSEEERADLLQLYERFHGDMDQVSFQFGRSSYVAPHVLGTMQSSRRLPQCALGCGSWRLQAADHALLICLLIQVMEWQICSEPKRDSHRFMDAIDAAIAEVPVATHMCQRPVV